MKITFVLPPVNMTGGIRVASIYAKLLGDRGHRVTVVSCPWPKPSFKQQVRSVLKGQGLIPTVKSASYFDNLDLDHRVLERYRPIVESDLPDADVVIATWWETAEWVNQLSPKKGAKAYFIQHYEIHDYLPVDRVKATWRLPLHKITIAQWLVDVAAHEYGDPTADLVPNAVDIEQFYAEPRGKQAVPTVGIMNSPAAWKGCALAYEAFRLAREQVPSLRLVAFGNKPLDGSLNFPEQGEFFQAPDQAVLRSLYARCDAWLFASRFEGFGLPILEAMACRTPVIGTPAGAAPELLAEGRGFLVDMDDPRSMAEAIATVAHMPETDWKVLSDRALAHAQQYTWKEAVVLFEAALERAIARNA